MSIMLWFVSDYYPFLLAHAKVWFYIATPLGDIPVAVVQHMQKGGSRGRDEGRSGSDD